MQISILLVAISLLASLLAVQPSTGAITVTPLGFTAAGESGDTLNDQLTIANLAEAEVSYQIKLVTPEERDRQQAGGPRRDDAGDILERYGIRYTNNIGLAWDPDREWMWGVNHENPPRLVAYNPAENRLEVDVEVPNVSGGAFYLDGVLYLDGRNENRNEIYRYAADGERLESWRTPFDLVESCFDSDGELFYLQHWQGGPITVYELDDWDEVATIDYEAVLGNATMYEMAWVPIHPRGQLWLYESGVLHQLYINDEWECEEVQSFQTIDGQWAGLEHDGHDLWLAFWRGDGTWYKIDDGVSEAYWLRADPLEGNIASGESAGVGITFIPGEMEAGAYEMLLEVLIGDDPAPSARMSCLLTVENPVSEITGIVTDAATTEPVENVQVSLDIYLYSRSSDVEGNYALQNLPPATYQLSFSAEDYLPETHEVQLGEDDIALNVELLHAECNLSRDEIAVQIAPDDEINVNLSASNDGNGPLTYRTERRLLGDANAAPWELRRNLNAGETANDDRIEGVAFDGDYYYFAGAAGADPSKIYVFDREGELDHSFDQLGRTRYGMKDLEFDGENLWGSGDSTVFCFDTDGEEVTTWRGPFNPTNNIAYDSEDNILWLCGTTTNIAAYDRAGNSLNRSLLRKGLRIYGIAYWPDDPDGYNLYIFNQPSEGPLAVHKMNTENGDTLLAYRFPLDANLAAGGIYICNTYDVYSWVLMAMQNVAPANGGDRLSIFQLDARKDWFTLQPEGGVIEAGRSEDFTMRLNTIGLPAVLFEGEVVFLHDGVHGSTHLPVSLDVVEGRVQSIRQVSLDLGWNMISTNLQPEEPVFADLMRLLIEAGQLMMVKDDHGHFMRVGPNAFDNLPDWEVAEGYLVKVSEATSLRLAGMTVMADTPLELSQGWQMIAYYPRRPANVVTALSGIVDQLQVVKDGLGNFYIPAYDYENIGPMREGQGYQLLLSEAVNLVYRTQGGGRDAASYASVWDRPVHYPRHPATGSNMSLLIEALGFDGEIGVYTAGELVGTGVLDRGRAGVAVWGDDASTEVIDGAVEGESLTFRFWDGAAEFATDVDFAEGNGNYTTDGFAQVAITGLASQPTEWSLSEPYPNPFNPSTTIKFALLEDSNVRLTVYDLSGREVATLVNGELKAGAHSATWNAEGFASGIYLVKMETPSFKATKKVMLVK